MRTWTEEAKAAQRTAIQRWKPWAKSTGPRTPEGKARAAMNARKGTTIGKMHRELKAIGACQYHIFRRLDIIDRLALPPSLESKRTIMRQDAILEMHILSHAVHLWFLRLIRLGQTSCDDIEEMPELPRLLHAA